MTAEPAEGRTAMRGHRLALAVHAERLHRPEVWRAVCELLDRIEQRSGRVTLFCHPFWARHEGSSIDAAVRELVERGHEIGQHTHFYARPAPGQAFEKRTVLTEENVRACLDEDYSQLNDAGVRPRGFVAGGWAVSEATLAWLAAHGFAYDTSFRTYSLRYESAPARAGDSRRAPFVAEGLLELPTTLPIARSALRPSVLRGARCRVGELTYTLAYVHDYDLLGRAKAAATSLLRLPGTKLEPVGEIAELVRRHLDRELR